MIERWTCKLLKLKFDDGIFHVVFLPGAIQDVWKKDESGNKKVSI